MIVAHIYRPLALQVPGVLIHVDQDLVDVARSGRQLLLQAPRLLLAWAPAFSGVAV